MDDNREYHGGDEADARRVRFKGIVEAERRALQGEDLGAFARPADDWNARSRQVWQVARLTAIFVFFSFVVGLPLGNAWAHIDINGSLAGWSPVAAFRIETLLYALIVPVLLLVSGYILSQAMTMMNAAESIAAAAQQMMTPDATAAANAQSVGAVVEGHVVALNEGLDDALRRLATVEAMIRRHVEAIEIAGDAIEQKAIVAVDRVADERSRLMELTESLNAHADSFAAAIAEKAMTGVEALQSADQITLRAENEFEERLAHLEQVAERAFVSFGALRDALLDTDDTMKMGSQAIEQAAERTLKATERAKAASNAAAESAAVNAANVIASAQRAADNAKAAADAAAKSAAADAERVAAAAIEAAAGQTDKVRDAAAASLDQIAEKSKTVIDAALSDAEKARRAAEDVASAAEATSAAAARSAKDVAEAGERARASAEDALKFSETTATKMEERNRALDAARAALEAENQRLEDLIEDQRKRADRLADAIASQTERLSRLAEAQLREQEASARFAEAQKELAARADRQAVEQQQRAQAEEESRRAAAEAERRAKAEAEAAAAARAAEEAKRRQAAEQAALELDQPTRRRKGDKAPASASRLDELARDIAERRPRGGGGEEKIRLQPKKEERAEKSSVSWKEILDAADDAEPLELKAPAAGKDDPISIIAQLQEFTYELETRLYGEPPPALTERYERGDRNVFANRLLRLNEADVRRRIRTESARDKSFERNVHDFLQSFERLLEDATTSETADEELEEYLGSPLGRVYLLIGATVGYFA